LEFYSNFRDNWKEKLRVRGQFNQIKRPAYLIFNVASPDLSYLLESCTWCLEVVSAHPFTALCAMIGELLIFACGKDPLVGSREDHGYHSGLMGQVIPQEGQAIAVFGQGVLGDCAVLLADVQVPGFRDVLDGRAAGRHILANTGPILAGVALQPNSNGSNRKTLICRGNHKTTIHI